MQKNYNMMIRLLVLVSLLSGSLAWAHNPEFWQSFDNEFIQMEMTYKNNPNVKSRYPIFLRKTLEGLLGWYPGTVWDMASRCSFSELNLALSAAGPLQSKSLVLDDFIQRCKPVYSKNNMMNVLKIISQRGSFHNHPFFKYSFLNFPNGLKTRALWGLRSEEKRDLIIIRPGVYANVDELIAERYMLFMLTELNDYHILVLENSTSGDHFVNNENVIIGGPKEAFENLYLIEQLRKHPKLSGLIGKVHLMGISLGANGVLLSSLINQKENHKYFDKTVLFCPVVDLKASFHAQMQNGAKPFIMDLWSSRRFQDLEGKENFELASFWSSLFSLTPRWVNSAWSWFEKKYKFQPEWQKYLPSEFYSGDFKKDYQFFNQQTRVPDNFYAIATKTDPIVFPEDNYEKLAAKTHENTFFYKFEDGFHCSMAYAYQWKFLDTFFTGIFGLPTQAEVKPVRKYQLTIEKVHPHAAETISGELQIRSVEVAKLDKDLVELLVYFTGEFSAETHSKSGHVVIPLKDLYLDEHFVEYDIEVIRSYIKRLIQTKFTIEKDSDAVFIKI
ncbi:MAG: hypothetical protein B7Y39_03195 [Bdellovibrio sp. 28-41-41]|nr:MAG: hypothetical protein B7Y39_03195 [Bdellovibrio sp. 28-41-41]